MATPKKKSIISKIKEKAAKLKSRLFDKYNFAANKKEAKKMLSSKNKDSMAVVLEFMESLKPLIRSRPGNTSDSIFELDEKGKKEVFLYDFVSEYNNGSFDYADSDFDPADGDVPMPMQRPLITRGGFALSEEANPTTPLQLINTIEQGNVSGNLPIVVSATVDVSKMKPTRKIKPIDVFDELERVPTPVTLENLIEKIEVLKLKKTFIRNNGYAKKEVIDMVTRLENRLKYEQFKDFFEQFDNTTTDNINKLVNKYKLVLKTSDLFIPKFPKEAMVIMDEYRKKVQELCEKSPVFYVIAEKAMFKEEEKRNDPILLVQSPFGIYWQILGAWDKELVLLEEL